MQPLENTPENWDKLLNNCHENWEELHAFENNHGYIFKNWFTGRIVYSKTRPHFWFSKASFKDIVQNLYSATTDKFVLKDPQRTKEILELMIDLRKKHMSAYFYNIRQSLSRFENKYLSKSWKLGATTSLEAADTVLQKINQHLIKHEVISTDACKQQGTESLIATLNQPDQQKEQTESENAPVKDDSKQQGTESLVATVNQPDQLKTEAEDRTAEEINDLAKKYPTVGWQDQLQIRKNVLECAKKFVNSPKIKELIDEDGIKKLNEAIASAKWGCTATEYFEIISAVRDYKIVSKNEIQAKITNPSTIELSPQNYPDEKSLKAKITGENTSVGQYPLGISESQGPKSYMEDRHLSGVFNINGHQAEFMAVFDGHGGFQSAEFMTNNFVDILKVEFLRRPSMSDVDIFNVLKLAFVKANDQWGNKPSGTTANFVLLLNGNLWVANVGDTRAVLGIKKQDGSIQTLQLSEDSSFKKGNKFEASAYKRGGRVGEIDGLDGRRLETSLAMGRSIGDARHQGRSPRPKITKLELSKLQNDESIVEIQLLICCDGIWDAIGSEEALKRVFSHIEKGNQAATGTMLIELAQKRGSEDNMTALLAKLK